MSETLDLTECTICSSCGSDIFDFFEKSGFPVAPYRKYVMDYILATEPIDDQDNKADDLYCEACKNKIASEEEYHFVTIPYKMLISIADNLSKDIGGCEHCHGNERRSMEHSFNSDRFESSPIELGGSSYDAGGYLGDLGVPDALNEVFVELIQCQDCGYGRSNRNDVDGGIFSKYDDVYTVREVDDFYGFGEFEAEEFSKFAEGYNENISLKDLSAFKETLRTQPMLAYRNGTGVAIYDVLKKHYEAQGYATLSTNEVELFRGRTRAIDSGTPYTIQQMWTAPQGKTSHGRYNFIGVSVLYVTNQEVAVPYEINPEHDQLIDIATFKILKKKLKLFDLGSFDPAFQGFFSELNEESNQLKSAYLLPNYIGACCSDIGYDGVIYTGVHQMKQGEEYTNYALFNMTFDLDLEPVSTEVKTYKPKITIELNLQEPHESEEEQKIKALFKAELNF